MNATQWRTYFAIFVFCLTSCSKEVSGDSGNPSARIATSLAAVQEMRRKLPHDLGLKSTERILSEANYTGAIREWGCIAVFDDNGNLIKAYTLKVKDFLTGRSFPMRMYTTAELEQARPQIAAYKKRAGIREQFPIPIISESFKLAAAETILNTNTHVQYAIGRGRRDLEVYKLVSGQTTVVAAEALFADKAALALAILERPAASEYKDQIREIERQIQNLAPGEGIEIGPKQLRALH